MSARIGVAVVMAYLLRRKREAELSPTAPTPEREPRPVPLPSLEDAHRDTGALDLIDDEVAQITDEHIGDRLRETLRRTGYAAVESGNYPSGPVPDIAPEPAPRCKNCGYIKSSGNCLFACGGDGP